MREARFKETVPMDADYVAYTSAVSNQAYNANALLDHSLCKQSSFLIQWNSAGAGTINFQAERTSAGTEQFVIQSNDAAGNQVITVSHGGCFIRAYINGISGGGQFTVWVKRV